MTNQRDMVILADAFAEVRTPPGKCDWCKVNKADHDLRGSREPACRFMRMIDELEDSDKFALCETCLSTVEAAVEGVLSHRDRVWTRHLAVRDVVTGRRTAGTDTCHAIELPLNGS